MHQQIINKIIQECKYCKLLTFEDYFDYKSCAKRTDNNQFFILTMDEIEALVESLLKSRKRCLEEILSAKSFSPPTYEPPIDPQSKSLKNILWKKFNYKNNKRY